MIGLQLADDFRRGQVAIKALMPRGAKTAVDRATGLTGHAQRAARVSGMYTVSTALPCPTSVSHLRVPSVET